MFIYYYSSVADNAVAISLPLPPSPSTSSSRHYCCCWRWLKLYNGAWSIYEKRCMNFKMISFPSKLNWFSSFPLPLTPSLTASLSLSFPLPSSAHHLATNFAFCVVFFFCSLCFTRQFTTLSAYNYTPTLHTHTHTGRHARICAHTLRIH